MKSIELTITVPAGKVENNSLKQEIEEIYVCTLYSRGELSSKEACDFLRLDDRRLFEEALSKYGFSIIRDTKSNIDSILSNLH